MCMILKFDEGDVTEARHLADDARKDSLASSIDSVEVVNELYWRYD